MFEVLVKRLGWTSIQLQTQHIYLHILLIIPFITIGIFVKYNN